jgi:alpha-1,6-mannosyltransferase
MDVVHRRARLATAGILGTSAVVALLASRPGSPFTPPLFPGARAPAFLAGASEALGLDRLPRDIVAVLGAAALFAAAGAFLYALGAAWRGDLSVRRVLVVGLALHALALIIPLFLSRDVYSYAIYGRMVSQHGANPYAQIPAAFTTDRMYPLVSVDWIDSRSVYGPAFTALSAAVTTLVSSPAGTVFAFKAVAAVASAATMVLAVPAARRVAPERAAFAAALVGWNPVVLFHGVAGGHNDALLGLSIAVALLAVLARRELWATVALTVGTMVKVSGAVPLLVAVAAAVLRRPRGSRLPALGLHAAVTAAAAFPFVLPFMQARDPTLGMLELTTRQGWLAPSRFVLVVVRGAANALGGDVAGDVASAIVRLAFPVAFIWVLVALLRHLARGRVEPVVVAAAMGWAALISLMVSPVLLPWYVAWLIPLAWVLPRSARGGAVLLSVALALTELVAEPSRAPRVWEAMVFGLHWVATPVVLMVLIRVLLDLRRRVAMPPAGGFSDPLLVEDLPPPSERPGQGEPALAVPSAKPPGGEIPGRGDRQDDDHRPEPAGEEADPLGGERAQDRHPDPY